MWFVKGRRGDSWPSLSQVVAILGSAVLRFLHVLGGLNLKDGDVGRLFFHRKHSRNG